MQNFINLKNKFIDEKYQLFINGVWTNGEKGETLTATSPANGEKLATFIDATEKDVDDAVKAAQQAFVSFSKTSDTQRAALLNKIADRIDANLEKLAMIETLDNGKPIRETRNIDIPLSSDHFRYFASVIRAEEGTVKEFDQNTMSIVIKEPVGVVGQIVPWNFPFLMAAWKLAPALAAGNCVVMKPSSDSSLSLLALMQIIEDLLPKGVVNIITGKGSKSGDFMLKHKGFDKLAFTGSTEVGYQVAKAAAEKLIPATLELGGKSANIIFDDANLDLAVDGATLGILFNQGQVCCAGSRIFVQEGIYDKFVAKLKAKFESVKVGNPWEEDTQMGSQINQRQLEQILKYVEIGKNEGAIVASGGIKKANLNGAFMEPTILEGNNQMRVACEEIFGPVATVIKFKTEEEAIVEANNSEYGLGGAVFTQNINQALRVAKAVRTGRMWVNTYNQLPAGSPFGGYKKSGIGRETHKSMLEAYSQMKNIYISTKETESGLY